MSTTEPTSLREHILAETEVEQGGTSAPVVAREPGAPPVEAPPQPPEPETPETEAASVKPDAEVSEAARTLRKNRSAERKAKIQTEIDTLVAERERLRADIARATEPRTPARQAPGAVPRPQITDPTDPEPQEADYQDYGKYLTDAARWAARDEFRQRQAASAATARRAQSEHRMQTHAAKLDAQHDAVRAEFADADAVIGDFLSHVRDNPRAGDIAEYLAESEVGGKITYRLGKDPEALKSVLEAKSRPALDRALALVEHAILSPAKPAAPVTRAPAPPRHVVGGGATTPLVDTRGGVPLADHIRIEEAEIAERRRAGYRY